MTHDEFDTAIDTYLAGGLAGPEIAAFEAHRKGCDPCAKGLEAAREFARFLSGALVPHGPSEDLDGRILSALRADGFQGRGRRGAGFLKLPPRPVRLAAAAVLAIVAGTLAMPTMMSARSPLLNARVDPVRLQGSVDHYNKEGDYRECVDGPPELSGYSRTPPPAAPLARSGPGNGDPEAEAWKGLLAAADGAEERAERARELRSEEADAPPAPPAEASSRKVIRTGTLEIEVESFEKAYRALVAILQEAGGFVASTATQKLANGRVRGTVVVRFPAERFDAVALRFKDLGEVRNQAVSTQDVTKLFFDTEANLRNKKTLEERLLDLLAKSKGNVKELLEVEKEIGNVRAEIERLEGEVRFLANQVALSTMTLDLRERNLEQPFEYVLSQEAQVQLVALDVPAAYERAQEALHAAGALILARDLRQEAQDAARATITARVAVERFGETVESLKKLGEAAQATISQNQRAVGGSPGKAGADAPVRKEMATVNLSIQTPPEAVTVRAMIAIEAADARSVHEAARGILADTKGKVTGGGFERTANGERGSLAAELPPAAFHAAVERLKGLGKVTSSTLNQEEPADRASVRREKGVITLSVRSPAPIVSEEAGPVALFRKTLAGSVDGIVWSARHLVVGTAYVGPWALLAWILWKVAGRRKKAA